MADVKFAVISTFNSPLNIPFLQQCRDAGCLPTAIIADSSLGQKSIDIVKERMIEGFEFKDLASLELTDIPTYFVKNHNSAECISLVKKLGVEYLVNCGTPRILKEEIIESVRGVINCHPGILPKYRGCTVVEWSIFNDDPVGATAHFMVRGIDEGPIIMAEVMPIEDGATYREIRTKMNGFQAQMLVKAVQKVTAEQMDLKSSPAQTGNSYFKPISAEEMLVVFAKTEAGKYRAK
jgi:methionyl-tRNA formyltransferase